VAIPATDEPVGVRVPLSVVEVQATDTQVAVPAAVDGPPEVGEPYVTILHGLPVLRDEVLVLHEVVEQGGGEHELLFQFLAELVALDPLTVLLILGQIHPHALRVPLELPARSVLGLILLIKFQALRDERRDVEIDDVLTHNDLALTTKETIHTFFAAELIPHCLDAAEGFQILGHDTILSWLLAKKLLTARELRGFNRCGHSQKSQVFGSCGYDQYIYL